MEEKNKNPESEVDVKKVKNEISKKLTREERKKIREKRKAESGFPTKMTGYLWFLLIFSNIVSFFDGWGTTAIMLAMSGWGSPFNLQNTLTQIHSGNYDLFAYFNISNQPVVMGIILSIAGIGVVAAVSFKFLVDKFGRRPLTLVTAVAFITFAFLTAFSPPGSPGLIYFLIVRMVANYFLSADVVVIIMAEESPDHLRGRLTGIVMALSNLGGFACGIMQLFGIRVPIAGPWGSTMTVWQSLYFMNIIGFILIIPLFFFLKETKRFEAMKKYENWRKKRGLQQKTGWMVPLQRKYLRPMALGMIAGFLVMVITYAQVTFFGYYLAKQMKMSPKLIGLVTLPIMISAGTGTLTAGPLMDRFGRLPTIKFFSIITLIGGTLISVPGVFVIGDIPNPLLQAIVVTGDCLGAVGLYIVTAGVTLLPLEMMPTHIRSTAMGWTSSVTRGAMILTPFLMMFGAETLGGLGLSYQFMFIFMDMIFFTAVYVVLMLAPETKGRDLEEIVATEVYYERKELVKKKDNKPYMYWAIYISSFVALCFLYYQTSGAPLSNMIIMLGFYTLLSAIGIITVYIVRKKVM
ncbi:MAG: MFS transporter [Candidatus Hodarchaeota archaeon]